MNKRIEELAIEAKLISSEPNGFDQTNLSKAQKKFAELIVRECAEQIISKGTDWVDFAPSQTGVRPEYWAMAQQIKQHFGVEL